MKKKIFWIYIVSIFVLFLAVGFIAKQWFVGADAVTSQDASWIDSCKFNAKPDNGQTTDGVIVVCADPELMRTTAMYMGDGIIWLKNDLCESYGITIPPGENYVIFSKSQLKEKLYCSSEKVKTAGDISDCCAFSHELSHACTDGLGSDSQEQMRCSEVPASNVEATCRNVYLDKICASNPLSDECKKYCAHDAVTDAAAKIWDACMCNESVNGVGSDGGTCCGCLNECKNSDRLKKLLPNYCVVNNLIDLSRQDSYCNFISSQDHTHNCDAYNNTQQDTHGNSLACVGGTGFDPSQCTKSFVTPYLPNTDVFPGDTLSYQCSSYGSEFVPVTSFIKAASCASRNNCSSDEQMYCPSGTCSDGSGGAQYYCIKSTCNLHTSSTGTATASSSTTSRALTDTANAGTPLSDVTIKVQKDRGPYSVTDNAIQTLGKTGTDGKISMSLLLGSWKVTAEKSGYKTVNQYVNIKQDTPFNLNFSMVSDGTVTPPVTPPTPPVVADKTLTVSVKLSTQQNIDTVVNGATVKISKDGKDYTQTTTTIGSVTFQNLEAGTWNIEVTKTGYSVSPASPTTANITYTSGQANILLIRAGGNLSVHAIDKVANTDKTLSEVAITIKNGNISQTKTTDVNGNAAFSDLIAGDWVVTGTKTNYHQEQDLTQSVHGDAPAANLVMDSDLKKLTVQVKMQSGTNVAKATVKITGPGGELSKQTGTNGTAVFTNLKIGDWSVKVTKSGYALANGQTTSVNLQEDTTKALTAQKAGTARFYIKGRTLGISTPLPNATIKLCDKPLNDTTKTCWTKQTNYLGMRTFQDMAPGRYYLEAKATNYATVGGNTITISASKTTTNTIQLERPSWYR